jgi:hypothetical protein
MSKPSAGWLVLGSSFPNPYLPQDQEARLGFSPEHVLYCIRQGDRPPGRARLHKQVKHKLVS